MSNTGRDIVKEIPATFGGLPQRGWTSAGVKLGAKPFVTGGISGLSCDPSVGPGAGAEHAGSI